MQPRLTEVVCGFDIRRFTTVNRAGLRTDLLHGQRLALEEVIRRSRTTTGPHENSLRLEKAGGDMLNLAKFGRKTPMQLRRFVGVGTEAQPNTFWGDVRCKQAES
jgi:hypothetical protein